jgi:hypothetical protein
MTILKMNAEGAKEKSDQRIDAKIYENLHFDVRQAGCVPGLRDTSQKHEREGREGNPNQSIDTEDTEEYQIYVFNVVASRMFTWTG